MAATMSITIDPSNPDVIIARGGNMVDMSRWGGNLTALEAEHLKDAGIVEAMPACGPGGYGEQTQAQADDILGAGLYLSAYTFFEWPGNPEQWIDAAWRSLGDYRDEIVRFAIDIEDVNNTPPNDWRNIVHRLFDRADYYWPNLKSRNQIVAYFPIWYATGHLGVSKYEDITVWNGKARYLHNSYYDGNPDISGMPACGWTYQTTAIEQFWDTTDVGGQSVDLNRIYIPATLPARTPTPINVEDDMNIEELTAFVDQRVSLLYLPLGRQMVGVDPATWSGDYEKQSVPIIQERIASLQPHGEGQHVTIPEVATGG